MQKNSTLFCAGWWPFLLIPLLLTTIVLFFSWQKIERKVAQSAQHLLSQEYSWSNVENYNRGRNILLTGTAPDQLAVEGALATASSAAGVRSVDFIGLVAAVLKPAQISIRFEGDEVVLSGRVNNDSSRKSIVDNARAEFGARAVIDQLEISQQIAGAPDISGVLATASLLSDGALLSIDGNNLKVLGKVKNAQQVNVLAARFARDFSGSIENNLSVDLHQQCLDKLSLLLAENMIYFDSGTTIIQARSNAVLNTIFETINGCPGIELQVDGHTDSTGSDQENLVLSKERAQSVVEQLVARGLQADRFTANGYGADKPVQSNDTSAGRAANRRIEFKLKN